MRLWIFLLLTALISQKVLAYSIGLGQTFGSDNYSGSRAPILLIEGPVDENDRRKLGFNFQIDTYKDDLISSRYYAFEPKIKFMSDKEGGIGASIRYIPPTDGYSLFDVGIEVRFLAVKNPRSDRETSYVIEDVELFGAVRRKSHSSDKDIRGVSGDFGSNEVYLLLGLALLHSDFGSFKPQIEFKFSKSFYGRDFTTLDRPAPMSELFSLTPFVQGYLNYSLGTEVYWYFGKTTGFSVKPSLFYTFSKFEGLALASNAFGLALHAGADRFGVFTSFEFYKLESVNMRNFLTLGFYVSL